MCQRPWDETCQGNSNGVQEKKKKVTEVCFQAKIEAKVELLLERRRFPKKMVRWPFPFVSCGFFFLYFYF